MNRHYGEEKRTLTTAQIREADRRCIEDLGIPGPVLMNNAGSAIYGEVRAGAVGIVCGKGNNGGDGFVVARLALLAGQATTVVLLAEPEGLSGDAATFMNVYRRLGGHIVVATDESDASQAVWALGDCHTLVDAMLGTGVSGEVHGPIASAIERWPDVYTVSVDVPSGMNADTGQPCGCCVSADVTVTLQHVKAGFVQPGARDYLGRLEVADIGIPPACADDELWKAVQERL